MYGCADAAPAATAVTACRSEGVRVAADFGIVDSGVLPDPKGGGRPRLYLAQRSIEPRKSRVLQVRGAVRLTGWLER